MSALQGKKGTILPFVKGGTNTGRQTPSSAQSHDQPSEAGFNPETPLYAPVTTTNALCSDTKKTVLLQTARSLVHNPTNPIEVRLLFDGGSQKSYIMERAKNLFTLEPRGEQLLSIWIKRRIDQGMSHCECGNVFEGLLSHSEYVAPTICQPLANQPIRTCIEYDKQLIS